MLQLEPNTSLSNSESNSQKSSTGRRNDIVDVITDSESQPTSITVLSPVSEEETVAQPKTILKAANKESLKPDASLLAAPQESVSWNQSTVSSPPEQSIPITSSPARIVPMASQPTPAQQTQASTSFLSSRPKTKSSGIPSDLFEIERIAQEIDEQEEEDVEDILDLDITDSQLSWTLAGTDDDSDDSDHSFDDDDDDEEDEDQFGRTRGSFFPYLPRGLNTPVLYSPRRVSPHATEYVTGNVPKPIGPTALEPVQSTLSISHPELGPLKESIGGKQVRFSEKVDVRQFQSQLPSSLVSTSSGPLTHNRHSKFESEDLKPENDEPKPKKISRFKLNRQICSGIDNPVQATTHSASARAVSDIVERQPSTALPSRMTSPKEFDDALERGSQSRVRHSVQSQSSIVSESTLANTIIEHDSPMSEQGKSNYSATLGDIKEREPPPPIPSIKPGSRQHPPEPRLGAGNRLKPVIIRRPIPKNRLSNSTSSQLPEPIDIELLVRENTIPNENLPHVHMQDESTDEVDEGSNRPLLSEAIVERPFEPPMPFDARKKQSLFKTSRATNYIAATSPSISAESQRSSSEMIEEQETTDNSIVGGIDDDMTLDPEIHRQEIAVAYHRMRQRIIDRQGGYSLKVSEREFVPLDENGEVAKISRFKSARLSEHTRSN
ncbi:hypothetical protein V1517DRAFT_45004 [Lipomyces orientalis]|uniref:Uncharacterized protein n=1 Tax=Lipomyces orientalis TaxID=1233043 RepID=A0ACC3TV63_9ASCO